MKRLPHPTLDALEVYKACIGAIRESRLAETFCAASSEMIKRADEYRDRAAGYSLHELPACARGNDDQVILDSLTKGDFNNLYERGMLNSPNGRTYYDNLRASAPLGKCPYCQFGHAETLDHFLSKSYYPIFSVVPVNLIPACMRCNKSKGSGMVTAAGEMSHPYFEDARIERDVWLFAEISETSPATAKYMFITPAHWPAGLARRMLNYFTDFELSNRFAVEAASELVSVSGYLGALSSPNLRLEHLQRVAKEERRLAKNGWKSALYAALSESSWYREVGYAGSGVA